MRLALIVDKSEAYVSFQRDRILADWNVSRSETSQISDLNDAPAATLFGDSPTALVTVDRAEVLKKLVDALAGHDTSSLEEAFPSGLLIACTVDRRQTKKLETTVAKLEGEVHAPAGNKEDPLAVKLIKDLGLSAHVRDFLLGYVGQDHEALLPMIQSLSSIPKTHRSRITEEDIYYRLPQAPGSVAPWEIEKYVMAGNVGKSIELARRINQHSSYLLWLAILKKKLVTSYRAAQIMNIDPRISDESLAAALGVPVKGLYFTKKNAKSLGIPRLEKATLSISRGEAMMKGASAAPGEAVSEKLIVELCQLLGGN